MQYRVPAILDIEASGFGHGSYPLEIGVALSDRTVHSFLIAPHADWTHWREDAAALHGLTREQLLAEGESPRTVAYALNELLEGQVVYSDGWGVDSGWLSLLYYYAGIAQAYRLETLARILSHEQMVLWDSAHDRIWAGQEHRRHRAGFDASQLQAIFVDTYDHIQQQRRHQQFHAE